MNEHRATWMSPLGEILLSASNDSLNGLWFHDQKYAPESFKATPYSKTSHASKILNLTIDWLQQYFGGEAPHHQALNAQPQGTEFQQLVWQALLTIPSGETTTYAELAQSINKPKAVRAVGTAVGRNPISLFIPCHRVIGANGSLTGYAGGLHRKEALLNLEGTFSTRLSLA